MINGEVGHSVRAMKVVLNATIFSRMRFVQVLGHFLLKPGC
jgi:hypothetical protein